MLIVYLYLVHRNFEVTEQTQVVYVFHASFNQNLSKAAFFECSIHSRENIRRFRADRWTQSFYM